MEKETKRVGQEELETTAVAFLDEIRDHIEAGDIDTAQTLIKGASIGLSMAEDADGEMREAFGIALAGFVGAILGAILEE